MTKITGFIVATLAAVAFADAFADPADSSLRPTLEQATVDGCRACHMGPMSLESWTAADLAQRIEEMAEGRADHLVPMPRLSDADREALAKALAGS